MLKWGKSCPQSWLEVFSNQIWQTQIPIPIPNAELHERQWRTNLLHEHGSLSLVNTSNIQHLVPPKVPFQKKSSSNCEARQRRFDLVITLLLPRFFVQSLNTSVCSCCHVDTLPLIEWSSEACKPLPPPPRLPAVKKNIPQVILNQPNPLISLS